MNCLQQIGIRKNYFLLALCWSCIMLFLMALDMYDTSHGVLEMARLEARTAIGKDIAYRQWNALSGGVYATISERTPPNPYLQVPDRDISTPSGRRLTLVNPAYMTRQVHDLERKLPGGLLSHITSLRPIRPANRPDPWEQQALRRFEQGEREVSTLADLQGRSYMRLMLPLRVEKNCLPCHARQGYREGDLRGGISASVPMAKWNALKRQHLGRGFLLFLAAWGAGLLGLRIDFRRLSEQIRKNQAVAAELRNIKLTLDRINDCVFMLDPESMRPLYVNRAVMERSGYSFEQLLHRPLSDMFPDLGPDYFKETVQLLVAGTRDALQFECNMVARDGAVHQVDVQLQYIKLEEGRGHVVAVLRDISRRKRIEQERKEMEHRLLQMHKLEAVGQLAAGIAHEINTPIQYVGSNIDFLEESFQDVTALVEQCLRLLEAAGRGRVPPPMVQALEEAMKELDWEYLADEIPDAIAQSRDGIQRVSSIVRAMKEFSHPAGREKKPVDLNRLIETTITVARNEWKYVADVETDLAENLPLVPCLTDEMNQVLLNLLVNAAHAVAEKTVGTGGGKGTISFTTRLAADMVEIRISDTGTGIAPEIREKIFDPFFTTKEVGKGTGQGLAISLDVIVNKHGGSLSVESVPGEGATFIIRLPV